MDVMFSRVKIQFQALAISPTSTDRIDFKQDERFLATTPYHD